METLLAHPLLFHCLPSCFGGHCYNWKLPPANREYISVSCFARNLGAGSVRALSNGAPVFLAGPKALSSCPLLLFFPLRRASKLLSNLLVPRPTSRSSEYYLFRFTVGSFAFQDPYPEVGNDEPNKSNSGKEYFDIDSEVSDTDLLELKQEIIKLGSGKAQRD